ncbi:hypothetical protein C3Y87_21360 [Carbonactinospora thermoautotrophica]|uniref:MMPL family transporter n=1 Tax=Carbonactinospora thermoautotrophica TaxID=1469144 RepID=UPI002272131D|nr:MMPL family transporter [Carbonactinospora thermoautotrophica]MCX9193877.1 hypothetical protein [Carbonactinospora thermoautotrophica]
MAHHRFPRPLLAACVVVAWLAIAGFAGPLTGKLSEVQKNDAAAFLPASAESTKVQRISARFSEEGTLPAVVVYERTSGLTPADRAKVAADARRFASLPEVAPPVSPPIPSGDGAALQVVVPLSTRDGLKLGDAVDQLRRVAGGGPAGLRAYVAGPAGLLGDLIEVFKLIDVTLLLVTAGVVLVILLVVYRSPVLWLIPMLSVGMAYVLSAAVVYLLAREGVVDLSGQSQGILTVLVFGAGTDYALLLISRYREELHRHERPPVAMGATLRGAGPAVLASAATVILALLCLLFSQLNSTRGLGPVGATGIACTLVAMLTFLPALLLLAGRKVFWPFVPRYGSGSQEAIGLWERIAVHVGRRPRTIWVTTSLVLLVLAAGLTQLRSTGVAQTESFVNRPDSVAGQEALARHFPAGAANPAVVVTRADRLDQVVAAARGVPGVVAIRVTPQTPPGQSAQRPDRAGATPPPAGAPKIVDGFAQLRVTFDAPADSRQAYDIVERLRAAVHAVPAADALVGGFDAVNLDTQQASRHDRAVVIPLVLAVILLVLALLLRAVLAPLLLIATVVLSFAAALGLCALLFRHLFGFPGEDSSFPLFAFVFLVALGIDYNIFLMTRVHEETKRLGTRAGTLRGLAVTGGVITSAGIVLAATFSALAVLPLVVLVELGVAVALGVLIDTVVVRSLLVPALTYDIGRLVWWPSRLARHPDTSRAPHPRADASLR